MNTHLSNISSLPSFGGTPAKTQAKSFKQLLGEFVAFFRDMPRRHREAAELAQLSDRELNDIGLTRGDLDRVQSPEFAADYHQGRTSALFTLRS